jgi:uncharacterized protein
MTTDIDALRKSIAGVCAEEPVRLAFLFGSYGTERVHEKSDIDVAVLLDRSLTKNERHKMLVRLYTRFGEALAEEGDRVDIALLNDASILLRFNVFLERKVLFEADRLERILYECAVWREYEDQEYALRQRVEMVLARIAGQYTIHLAP